MQRAGQPCVLFASSLLLVAHEREKRMKEKGTKQHREEGGKGRDKSEKKIMYRLAGRGGFYVAVAVDDLRFLRVTHSLPLHDRNV